MQSTNSEHRSPYLVTYVTHHFTLLLLLLDIIINTQIKKSCYKICIYFNNILMIAIMFLLQFLVEIELFIGGYYKNMTDLSRNTLNTRPCPSGSHLIRRWKSVRRSGNIYSLCWKESALEHNFSLWLSYYTFPLSHRLLQIEPLSSVKMLTHVTGFNSRAQNIEYPDMPTICCCTFQIWL